MFLSYQQIEYAISEKKNLKYFFYGIIWKRRLLLLVLSLFIINIAFSNIWGNELKLYQYPYLLYLPAISYFIAALLMFITENILLRNFSALDIDQKQQRIKKIFYLASGFYLFGGIGGINYDIITFTFEEISKQLFIKLIICLIISAFFFSTIYRKLKEEIDRKRLFNK